MIFKGFRFGMLLQLSIGPMCLLVFNTAGTHGLLMGLILVCAITIVDAAYISLAGIGVASILDNEKTKLIIKLFGAIVLTLFGANTILAAIGFSILPDVQLFSNINAANIFIQGILLTASNPLTIIFWAGVFGAEVINKKLDKNRLILFGIGCVLSTIIFLSGVAVLGSIVNSFLPNMVIQGLNILVGFILIIFAARLLLKKT